MIPVHVFRPISSLAPVPKTAAASAMTPCKQMRPAMLPIHVVCHVVGPPEGGTAAWTFMSHDECGQQPLAWYRLGGAK